MKTEIRPWPALWALCLGFFMIIVDSTIVAVANPVITADLNTDVNAVIWVTSSYLLAYAVPLLVTGRLGDRFGPKNLYLIGLVVFTLASLWCGLSGDVAMLIVARVFQGLGAAMMTPQTMAVIARIFPPNKRGAAMGMWGSVAGIATLVGPILGGVLVDNLGWEWIFFINLPVGAIGFLLAWRLVPSLPTNNHKFDMIGVALSAIGLFCIVFGLQEGGSYDWDGRTWGLIGAGLVVMGGFVWWQKVNRDEPLVPLGLFKDRNFSVATVGIATMGFAVTSVMLPFMFYAQSVTGLSPTRSALLMAPLAVVTAVLAPFVGRLVDRTHPRYIAGPGFLMFALSIAWLATQLTPSTPIWQILASTTMIGASNALIWAPLAATATRNLPPAHVGAGSGVYNTTRQVGAVLGSAAMGALMTSRITAEVPGAGGASVHEGFFVGQLPELVREPFSTAMAQSTMLPAAALMLGFVAVLFFVDPRKGTGTQHVSISRDDREPVPAEG
ncbi:DHA2 family efflux MFS transporter permease subunit [Rhodococcus spongiicola]|uniref:DHA2 family efflux MFS transporter permease subunit n=1 Tax=Rhodococcus spongiicola TaxID=2487352 RepID=A0A3S3BPV8_9NOCA|nr:DHA2 family efflux MFS transporter permease subunit [Rhodococcus spongiicola]RVW06388.1 DHA2 family efflux MFS transporter permease subunit [Rhodococcus spongiicola]